MPTVRQIGCAVLISLMIVCGCGDGNGANAVNGGKSDGEPPKKDGKKEVPLGPDGKPLE